MPSSFFSPRTLGEQNSLFPLRWLIRNKSLTNQSLFTNTATDSSASSVNLDGTYTVAGWTWNPNNAVTDGSVVSEGSDISTFPSAFLQNQGQPLAQQTVGNILFGQPNYSVTLDPSDTTRSVIELTWGGQALPNEIGNDFVVYENGDINAPEGYAVAVRIAGTNTFTSYRYEFYDTFENEVPGNPDAGVLATAFDLSDFGLAPGQRIDAIQIVNLQSNDLVDGLGQGFLAPSGTTPLDPSTAAPFALSKLDPDITFVAGLHDLQPQPPSRFDIAGTGDFNGDGQPDILLRNLGTGQNAIWLMNGTEIAQVAFTTPVADPNWVIGGTGDFNGDGQTDILWRNQFTGVDAVWLMNGTEFSEAVSIISPEEDNLDWSFTGTGDFNSDGQTDILLHNQVTGDNVVWLMDGTELRRGLFIPSVADSNWDVGGTGDFSGDGQTDILWRNQSTGVNAVWLMDGTDWSGVTSLTPVQDPDWVIGSTGDFNGDGQTDIIFRNQVTEVTAAWLLNGTDLAAVSYLA